MNTDFYLMPRKIMNESILLLTFYAFIAYIGKIYLTFIRVNTLRLLAKNKSLQN